MVAEYINIIFLEKTSCMLSQDGLSKDF
jgi:hypothetical protein